MQRGGAADEEFQRGCVSHGEQAALPPTSEPPAPAPKPLEPAPMKRRKPPRSREWKRRDKVSACTSSLFPWEVVFEILFRKSPRSLVLLQMVNKGLRTMLAAENMLWIRVFKRHVYFTAYNCVKVHSQEFPLLTLYKPGLAGVPVHMGRLRTDPDGSVLPPEFDASFSAYTRKAFALKVVDRCGLCGCRHRHEAYWSLGMRVCQLCMAANTLSCWELVDKYGVHYYDIMREISGKVFYFNLAASLMQHRMAFHTTHRCHASNKQLLLMLWRPHLEKILDLPALYQEQLRRRESAKTLCAILRRLRVRSLRLAHSARPMRSMDCLVIKLLSEEKRRLCSPYISKWFHTGSIVRPGDGSWAFWENPVCRKTRHQQRHGESVQALSTHLSKWEDVVVSV
jgi:hypothetical protein